MHGGFSSEVHDKVIQEVILVVVKVQDIPESVVEENVIIDIPEVVVQVATKMVEVQNLSVSWVRMLSL